MAVPDRLKLWERGGLWFFAGIILLFGVLVTHRSAFLSRRMGDAGIMFRAGWAARMGGEQLHTVTCDNGLHFHYPPVAALLFVPFADPPPGEPPILAPSYAASVALWYAICVGCILLGLHLLASALEAAEVRPTAPCGRRWWALRFIPLLVCLPCIGSTLSKGQVTPVLFLLIAAGFATAIRGRQLLSGVGLAGAACLKIFPAFLFLLPMWRRDARAITGVALGLVLGLVILPVLYFGPVRTLESYTQLEKVLIAPALGWGTDDSRGAELHNTTGTYSQSLANVVTTTLYPDRTTRPEKVPALVRAIHWSLAACLTLATLWAFRRRPTTAQAQTQQTALFGGALALVMLLVSPVCHLHYLMLALPAVLALVAVERDSSGQPRPWLLLILAAHIASVVLAQLPGLIVLKDHCLPALGVVLLWGVTCRVGHRLSQPAVVEANPEPALRTAA